MTAGARRLEPLTLAAAAAALSAGAVWLSYAVNPFAPLIAVAALGGAVLALARPMVALLLALALVPLELFSLPLGGSAGLSPTEGMLLLTGVGWGTRRLVEGLPPFVPSPLGKPLLALVLAVVPGIAVAVDPFPVVKVIVMWGAFLLVYQLIVAEATPRDIRWILLALAFSGAVVGAVAAVSSSGQSQQLIDQGTQALGRAQGSFAHPNTLAAFLAMVLPGGLALGVSDPSRLRPVGLLAFGLTLAGLVLSLSRGGLLAAGGAIAVMLAVRPFRRAAALTAILGILVVLLGGGSALGGVQEVDIVTKRLESVSGAAQGADPRVQLWSTVPEIIADYPLFGVGAAGFASVSPRYGLLDPYTSEPFDHAHNIPLTVLAELGLVGFAVLVWMSVALALTVVRAWRRSEGSERALAFAVTASLVSVALQGMVDYNVRSNVIVGAFAVLAACAVVLSAERADVRGAG